MSTTAQKIKQLNSECENALIDFPFHDKVETWLHDHQLLFAACTYLSDELALSKSNVIPTNFINQFQKIFLENNKK
jgi:hypothetical protein